MEALFVELPPFERYRAEYLNDDEFREFQQQLLKNPLCGDVIQKTGGLRKVRFADSRRNKGKRGGIRVIYYWYLEKSHFLLFTLYDKDQKDDLTTTQREQLREMLEQAKKRRK
ncbi:type II toxin-antitoxin system RelE/ParE family toxin [Erwinia pyrifoliae]|uniref:type II toxin-antitoxin system RelE/ParE family toxin n=1 Tax=Erwinia pyrifoliae TaxID=79967 RepID=UPI0021FC98BC|nr:type II toxin-antitoxin system RelE/ParE family toxin [Erwinia pyrifoliae]MCT2385697.1 type II toxin-antitoxin system RelE/ParE family toxin [Erwinia pyrifoliae]MCU8588727.1 type II toxin-antitoxin system RelE/ParE family toxin [Erwinia pyrifoliae]UWS29088.1 type II toxin-antitoxin system RelE/ParE family toxin [Erwinia pyrifoliae]